MFRVGDQAVQNRQHLPLHPGRRGAAAQPTQFLLGRGFPRGRRLLLSAGLDCVKLFLGNQGRIIALAGVLGVLQNAGHHVFVPQLSHLIGDVPLFQSLC